MLLHRLFPRRTKFPVHSLCLWYQILHGLFPISSQHMLQICLSSTRTLDQMLMPSPDLLQSHIHIYMKIYMNVYIYIYTQSDFATGYQPFLLSSI